MFWNGILYFYDSITNWMQARKRTRVRQAAKPKKSKKATKVPKAKGEIVLDSSSEFDTPKYKKDKYENFFTISASGGETKLEMRAADAAGLGGVGRGCVGAAGP